MYVDSHCHLSFPELAEQLPEIRAAMAAADVDRALCICTTLEEFERVHALALGYDNFWCSAGVHPDNEDVREPSVDDLLALAARPKVVAIGETGLDYYRLDGRSVADMEWQRERFRVHIRAARATRPAARHPHPQRLAPTRSASCARRARARPAASSTASPRPPRWRAPRSTSASTSRSPAS